MLDWLKSLLGEGYTEDIDANVSKKIGELFVSKQDFNDKNIEVKNLRKDLATANTKIVGLEKVDTEGLQKQLNDERNGRIKDKKEFALKSLLSQSGCKDIDYVLYKLGDTVEFDEKGEIKDAESFVNRTKEAYASQFAEEPAGGTGSKGNFRRSSGEALTKEEILKKPYAERISLYNEDPEAFNTAMKG